jgi:hypothetical protein
MVAAISPRGFTNALPSEDMKNAIKEEEAATHTED